MSGSFAYLDSSALAKVVVNELHSQVLDDYLQSWPHRISSALARLEVALVGRRTWQTDQALTETDNALRWLEVLPIDAHVLNAARRVATPVLRALDAIHLATALQLGEDLGVFITYDRRLGQAALAAGLVVAAPGFPTPTA